MASESHKANDPTGEQGSGPTDDVRVGHAERQKAADDLAEHFAQGRLEQAEFEERTGAAWQAKTAADLKPLFFDLPGGSLNGYLSSQATAGAERSARAPAKSSESAEVAHTEDGDAGANGGWNVTLSILMGIVPFIALALFMLMSSANVDAAWVAFLLIPIVYVIGGRIRRSGSGGCNES